MAGQSIGLRETVFELAYPAELAPWFSLQPDVQYVASPSGDRAVPDAVVTGLRIKIGR